MPLTEDQYQAGRKAAEAESATHYRIWVALKEAGVPVREGSTTPASTAATQIAEDVLRDRGIEPPCLKDFL